VSSFRTSGLRILASFLVVLALLSPSSHCFFVVRGADEASLSVESADVAVRQAFNATLDAERAGVDVSDLILRLNLASSVLEEAENALRVGNSSGAVDKANECIAIANSVLSDADYLKTSTLSEGPTVFLTTLNFSVVSIATFAATLVVVWGLLKRRYAEKMMDVKT
jgi:hypothetical protein